MRIRSAVLTALALTCLAAPAAAQPVPSGYTYHDEWLTSFDGTQLHAGVFLPADRTATERHPMIMVAGPYTSHNGGTTTVGNTTGPVIRFPELFTQKPFRDGRYGMVQLDVRGFGGSGGCFEYYGPNEARDVASGVEWASKRDWSTGKLALWGKSYDGADALLGVAERAQGLAAAVIQAPGLSAYTALWMNGIHYAGGRYLTTATYTVEDLLPGQNLDSIGSPEYAAASLAPLTSLASNPTCRTDALVKMNVVADRGDPFWAGREPYRKAAGAEIPVLWTHGFYDANTKPVHLDVYGKIAGPKYAWFGQFDHLRGHEAGVGGKARADLFLPQAFRFLDEHLRGVVPAASDPAVVVQEGNGAQRWRTEQQWPPADALPWDLPLRAGAYTDAPGSSAGSESGTGVWTFTKPLPHNAHVAGEMELDVPVTTTLPGAHLVAIVYDVDETGRAVFVQRGATLLPAAGAQRATFALYPQDWRFVAGHRIAVRIQPGDDDWFSAPLTNSTVTVGAGELTLPLLATARTRFAPGGVSVGSGVAPFTVPAATIAAAEVDAVPPAQAP